MQHRLTDIAKDHRFDALSFIEFAINYQDKYSILHTTEYFVSTWFSDALVADYKKYCKAVELFTIFSNSMNAQKDTYCNNFDYLEKRNKDAWLAVATAVMSTK